MTDVLTRAMIQMEACGLTYDQAEAAIGAITQAGLFLCTEQVANMSFDIEGATVEGSVIEGEWEPMISMPISEYEELRDSANWANLQRTAAEERLLKGIQQAMKRLGGDPLFYDATGMSLGDLGDFNGQLPRLINAYLETVEYYANDAEGDMLQ